MELDLISSARSQENENPHTGADNKISETYNFGPNFICMPSSNGVRELQTVIRDKTTPRSDFIFYADRLIRLIVEEGLNKLPYSKCTVTTPTVPIERMGKAAFFSRCPDLTKVSSKLLLRLLFDLGQTYEGLHYEKGNCGVSIIRSGEAMEEGLRDCCRSIRIGKILIRSDADTRDAHVVYANLPKDIHQRKVLLMYPIMGTGNAVMKAVKILKQHNVKETNVILLNLFCTPEAAQNVISKFPDMTILTSEVHPVAPSHFGQKYFGTD